MVGVTKVNSRDLLTQIGAEIRNAREIAIFSHIRPDGDTLGSLFGLAQALINAGKSVQLICSDPLPKDGWFSNSGSDLPARVRTAPERFDLSICVDISSIERAGNYFIENAGVTPDIVIDHHYSNPGFGKLNYIDAEAASNCEILTEIMPLIGLTIDPVGANFLLSGILTDTQGFSTSNVSAKTLRLAADLVDLGGGLYRLFSDVIKAHSLEANGIWEIGLRNAVVDLPLIWTVIRQSEREKTKYADSDDANVINRLISSNGVKVAIVFMESADGKRTKVSLRGKPGYNVAAVAESFGGGGHLAAAGADIGMALNETVEAVVAAARAMIAEASR